MSQPTRDENKRSIDQLFLTCFNQGDLAQLDRLVAPEYIDPQSHEHGPAAFRTVMTRLRGAFPDIRYHLDDVVAEDERVAVRWHWTGTHTGPFRTFAPTGKTVSSTGAGVFRLKDGKIVAAVLETDRLGFLQQIGVLPDNVGGAPPPPPARLPRGSLPC